MRSMVEGASALQERVTADAPSTAQLRGPPSPLSRGRIINSTPSPPFSSMKRAISSTPLPARRLVKTKGRAPRMRLLSRSMVSSEAPT